MKRWLLGALVTMCLLLFSACAATQSQPNIAATTLPVFTFTEALCEGTPLTVGQLVQENVSCLHDYTLTVKHMKMLEGADLIVISGGGLEDFLHDALTGHKALIDASDGIDMHCAAHAHQDHSDHHHDADPHFWLSVEKADHMAHTICDGLKTAYPQYSAQFDENLAGLERSFTQLSDYARSQLSNLTNRELITFHDGFSYMAEELGLTVLHALEEEAGSEASAAELIHICNTVAEHAVPAVFVEKNGSDAAAKIISKETGAAIYCLDMAMSGSNYFDIMYHNIDILKEALG